MLTIAHIITLSGSQWPSLITAEYIEQVLQAVGYTGHQHHQLSTQPQVDYEALNECSALVVPDTFFGKTLPALYILATLELSEVNCCTVITRNGPTTRPFPYMLRPSQRPISQLYTKPILEVDVSLQEWQASLQRQVRYLLF